MPQAGEDNASTATSYFSFPVRYAVSGVLRRLSSDPLNRKASPRSLPDRGRATSPPNLPPPFQPPPLTAITLRGGSRRAEVLSKQLAEEIRLLIPARLQLVEHWNLVFSLELDGASLSTLYDRCEDLNHSRVGFVLVVKDSYGDVFGSYLNEAPRPSSGHYFGNGECFLWRAYVLSAIPTLSSLPPPPSSDTTNMQRMTTIGSPKNNQSNLLYPSSGNGVRPRTSNSGTNTPERIRFKAFPYSGVNDYIIFGQSDFISIGGGDGHDGLWLDASLEKGTSNACLTFGNEPLSDEGVKFDINAVEIWCIGP